MNRIQWRSQDFLKEGSEFHGPQCTPYQKLKTYRIWPTIFWKGPNLTKKAKKNAMSGLGAHPRTEKAQFVFECPKTLIGPSP